MLAAYSGPEALELAKAERPDVILLDIMMPEMNGIEVCRTLKADPDLSYIPVIMVTAKDQEQDVIAGLDAGVAAWPRPYVDRQQLTSGSAG